MVEAAGASVVVPQVGAASRVPPVVAPAWSATDTAVSVVLPELVTLKL